VAERGYSLDMYHGAVAKYPFMDHNAPAFELLLPCCAHMHRHLQAHPDNVVAVHCKAGKGRTGLIIVCYLLYCGLKNKALHARKFYDTQRCHDQKGLTIISQIRYAHYFEQYLRRLKQGAVCHVTEPEAPAIAIFSVSIHGIPRTSNGGCEPSLVIAVRRDEDHEEYVVFKSRDYEAPKHVEQRDRQWQLFLSKHVSGGVRVAGDIKIEVVERHKSLCHVWVHSQFMQEPPDAMAGVSRSLSDEECASTGVPPGAFSLLMSKHEIDGAAKDVKHTQFPSGFQLQVVWGFIDGQTGTGPALASAAQEGPKRKERLEHKPIEEKILYAEHCAKHRSAGLPPMSFVSFVFSLSESQSVVAGSPQMQPSPKKRLRNLRRPSPMSSPLATGGLGSIQEDDDPETEEGPEIEMSPEADPISIRLRASADSLLAHARKETARLWKAERDPPHAETGVCVDRMCALTSECVLLLSNVL